MVDYMFLTSMELIKKDYTEWLNQLFNLDCQINFDEAIWKDTTNLTNEIEKLIGIVKFCERVDYETAKSDFDSTCQKANKYFNTTKEKLEAITKTSTFSKTTFGSFKLEFDKIQKKFIRCVKNHIEYYKAN